MISSHLSHWFWIFFLKTRTITWRYSFGYSQNTNILINQNFDQILIRSSSLDSIALNMIIAFHIIYRTRQAFFNLTDTRSIWYSCLQMMKGTLSKYYCRNFRSEFFCTLWRYHFLSSLIFYRHAIIIWWKIDVTRQIDPIEIITKKENVKFIWSRSRIRFRSSYHSWHDRHYSRYQR